MNNDSLSISKIIHGGYGLGTLADGRKAMILLALPGEDVTFSTIEMKKNYVIGIALQLKTQSRFRIAPPCPYYSLCGGCDLQHSTYEQQLCIKHQIIIDLMRRQFPDLSENTLQCLVSPPLPSPDQFHYRQRIRLRVNKDSSCGFRRHKSHEIVEIKKCLLARQEINDIFEQLLQHGEFQELIAHTSEMELLFNPSSNMVTMLLHRTRKVRPADYRSADKIAKTVSGLERIFFQGESFPIMIAAPRDSDNRMYTMLNDLKMLSKPVMLSWEVGGFCQVNLKQNLNMINVVLEYAAVTSTETVLDLFCGAGNFSIPLAHMAGEVTGIEGQGAAIRSARANSEASSLTNTHFIKSPIHQACVKLVQSGESFDCIVVDPPRQGIPGLARELHTLCRSRMVYISCDPATLCRDLAELSTTGFVIKRIQPVDMFPQTHHIETIVFLEKN